MNGLMWFTCEEAEAECLTYRKSWINNNKTDLQFKTEQTLDWVKTDPSHTSIEYEQYVKVRVCLSF